ncbi:MAG: hypothetical protein WCJ09_12945 [Planctomycetota bacterium]
MTVAGRFSVWLSVVFIATACQLTHAGDEPAVDSELTAEIRAVAENIDGILQSNVSKIPIVVRMDRTRMEKLAKQMGSPHHRQLCFFLAQENQIIVRTGEELGSESALSVRQIPLLRRVTLAHELAHAWQHEKVLPNMPKERRIDRMVLHAILEGHAQWVSLRYAERNGLTQRRTSYDSANPKTTDEVESRFIYQDGLRYWNYRVARDQKISVEAVLCDETITQRTIAYPDLPPIDPQAPSLRPDVLITDDPSAIWRPTDFISFRQLAMELSLFPRRTEFCSTYESGWRAGSQKQSVAIVKLSTAESCSVLFDTLSRREEKQSTELHVPSVKKMRAVAYASNATPAPRMSLFLTFDKCVIEFDEESVSQRSLREWAENFIQRVLTEIPQTEIPQSGN